MRSCVATIPSLVVLALTVSICLLSCRSAQAAGEITLTSPSDYQVFQRRTETVGTATISGRVAIEGELHYRWVGKTLRGRSLSRWFRLAHNSGGEFSAAVTLPAGGWYRLELEVMNGRSAAGTSVVNHVGIGEVFVVSGQSNSTNYGSEKLVPETGLVSSFDGKRWKLAEDPQGGCDGSNGGSFLPAFGDEIVRRYHVPVGVASTGQGGTSVRQFLPAGSRVQNEPTTGGMKQVGPHEWESDGGLFDRLASRCKALGQHGFRAILWHQGESDAGQARAGYPADRQITGDQYYAFMQQLIQALQNAVGWEAPWITAQTTYHVGDPSDAEFRAAMKRLWDTGVSIEGPDTDALREEYRSGVHFNGKGQRKHGQLWAEKVAPIIDRSLHPTGRATGEELPAASSD